MRAPVLAAAAILLGACGGGLLPASEASPTPPRPELQTVRIGAVAPEDFIQLPLALAQERGYFSSRGVAVQVVAEPSGLAALTSLGKGDVDVISAPYEFTIRAQTSGTQIEGIALYQLRPGFVLSVGKPHFNDVHSMRDLVGHPVCVTARGTQSENTVRWLALRDGVDPSTIPLRSCGTAIANYSTVLANGDVWAAIQVDPPFAKLEHEGWARALYDTRSEQGAKQVYGGSGIYPTQALIVPSQFLASYPNTSFALVAAIVDALHYIHSHSAAQIAGWMPAGFKQGDPDLYVSSLKSNLGMFSPDGVMPPEGPGQVMRVLQAVDPGLADAHVALSQTFDDTLARRAAANLP